MEWKRRQKRLAKSQVQRAMIAHMALHWTLFLGCTLLLLVGWQVMFGEPAGTMGEHVERTWYRHGPAFIVLLVLMPVVVLDTLKLGCRIAGPMIRLGNALRQLAEGQRVENVRLRKGDFWHEIADDFNTLLDRLGHRAPGAARLDDEAADREDDDSKTTHALTAAASN